MKAVVAAFNQEKALVGAFSVIVQLHRLIDFRHYARVCRHLEWAASRYWLQFDTNLNSRGNGPALPLSSRPPRKWLNSFNVLISIECRRRTVFTWLHSIDIMQKLEKVGKLPLKVVSIGWTLRYSWVQSSNDWNIKVFYPPSPYTSYMIYWMFQPYFLRSMIQTQECMTKGIFCIL